MTTAIREYPRHIASERQFVVTYVKGNCQCENCQHKLKIDRATNRADAHAQFQARCPFAEVVRIDPYSS